MTDGVAVCVRRERNGGAIGPHRHLLSHAGNLEDEPGASREAARHDPDGPADRPEALELYLHGRRARRDVRECVGAIRSREGVAPRVSRGVEDHHVRAGHNPARLILHRAAKTADGQLGHGRPAGAREEKKCGEDHEAHSATQAMFGPRDRR